MNTKGDPMKKTTKQPKKTRPKPQPVTLTPQPDWNLGHVATITVSTVPTPKFLEQLIVKSKGAWQWPTK